jgi:dipeptidyl aminopeptidase/acylaminoacyl peptidase
MVAMRTALLLVLLAWTSSFAQNAAPQKRPLRLDDLYQLRAVKDPQRSPDGNWVAFTVSAVDVKKDKNISHLWLASWDGKQERQLTFSAQGEDTPRWSADGRQLAFLSARTDACEKPQLWLLPVAAGGEAVRLTEFQRDIDDFAWSPDGKRLVLVVEDDPDEMTPEKPEPEAGPGKPKPGAASAAPDEKDADEHCPLKDKKPKPIEVTRYKFKEDIAGYLTRKRSHLYLFDMESRKSELLTPGDYDELLPAWSPDGKWVAFVSKRHPADPDRTDNWDVFVIEPRVGAQAKQLTTSIGQDNSPLGESPLAWSPDSTRVAYVAGLPDPKFYAYDQPVLAITDLSGGAREIGRGLDRNQSGPQWSADGKSVAVLLEDDRSVLPISIDLASGRSSPLLRGELTVSALSAARDGGLAALLSTDSAPEEVVAVENGEMRPLSHQNDKWLSEVQLAPVEDFTSLSSDGTEVHGLITRPFSSGQKLPTLLRIHGGPNGQDQHEFRFDWQLFAANGYAVIAPNYRGGSGRGAAYQRAIYADWGHKEVLDLLGAVDHCLKSGLADPGKLGIGGWSYGGILTDFTIASDTRFKAAASGAGSALTLAMYGVDEYVTQYTLELGPPWKTTDLWLKLSYPFLHADRIKTPTLFLGGDRDFNVPLIGGEEMYQALRELNVPSELVIYPGEFHGIKRPSFKRHRLERYLQWYDRWIKGAAPSPNK